MTMQPLLEVQLDGQLGQAGLDRFRKLLNLAPQGRRTDTGDAHFGHRALVGTTGATVSLDLWRRDGTGWVVRLTHAGSPVPEGVVARCRAEVSGAAVAVGVPVGRVWPPAAVPRPEPLDLPARPEPLDLPARRAMSARLGDGPGPTGWLPPDTVERLVGALALERERGGPSGTEFGWRYVRWDPPYASVLLQFFDDPGRGPEVALLYDRQPPADGVVAGCRLQVEVAAAGAGLRVVRFAPELAPEPAIDWAMVIHRAVAVGTLRALLAMLGCTGDTAPEMVRGRLLALTRRPEWATVSPRLRHQVEDLLL